MTKWTNITLRQKLGEAGFIEERETRSHNRVTGTTVSKWRRGATEVELWEQLGYIEPTIMYNNNPITPEELGVRNENIQNDGSPDE